MARRNRSFEPNGSRTLTLPTGQVAHELHVAQSKRLERSFSEVRPGVWCFVGNGLSNQSFIDAPEGIIAIDTGESIEEMNEAIAELRKVSQRPIVAVMYTHFHYVDGTKAVVAENNASKCLFGDMKKLLKTVAEPRVKLHLPMAEVWLSNLPCSFPKMEKMVE